MRRLAQILVPAATACSILVGCATIGPPRPPSLDLPAPPSDLRAARKGERVVLSWTIPTTTTDRENVRTLGPTQICRGPGEMKACGAPIGQVSTPIPPSHPSKQKPEASFTDTLPPELLSDSPDASITYSVQVLNRAGRSAGLSNQIRLPLIRTMPPPRRLNVRVTKDGIALRWDGTPVSAAPGDVKYVYRVYRRAEGNNEPVLAGEAAAGESEMTFNDNTIEWQKTYYYRVEPVTTIQRDNNSLLAVEGSDSPEVKVFADDVFPPTVPSDLQAVFSGPGQKAFVDLVWAPVTDADLAGYNVYRREEGGVPIKLNSELVLTPAYRDLTVAPQKHYFYSVTSVDVRGNESAYSEEAQETVP